MCKRNWMLMIILSLIIIFLCLLSFAAQSNGNTRHLAKLLIHLSWCLQELLQAYSSDDDDDDAHSSLYKKALNATYISSLFLKHLIENGKSEELHLSLDESEPVPHGFVMGNYSLY